MLILWKNRRKCTQNDYRPGAYICNECIQVCNEIIEEGNFIEEERYTLNEDEKLPTPEEIRKVLDEYVIGQEEKKNIVCCSIQSL